MASKQWWCMEMKQETFADIEHSFRRKKTKREGFLEIMDAGALYSSIRRCGSRLARLG